MNKAQANKLFALIQREQVRIKDMEEIGMKAGAGDYYRLLEELAKLYQDMERLRRNQLISRKLSGQRAAV